MRRNRACCRHQDTVLYGRRPGVTGGEADIAADNIRGIGCKNRFTVLLPIGRDAQARRCAHDPSGKLYAIRQVGDGRGRQADGRAGDNLFAVRCAGIVAVGVGVAVLTADGATVLVAGIGSGPGRDAAAVYLDRGTVGILAAADARAPVGAVGIDGAAVDVDGAMLRADARSVYPQTLGIGNQLFSPFLSCFYCLSRNNA